ncbi:MAG: hypothetical protein QW412_03615 [Candidatus Aenigmatarchaeota archaeon]
MYSRPCKEVVKEFMKTVKKKEYLYARSESDDKGFFQGKDGKIIYIRKGKVGIIRDVDKDASLRIQFPYKSSNPPHELVEVFTTKNGWWEVPISVLVKSELSKEEKNSLDEKVLDKLFYSKTL